MNVVLTIKLFNCVIFYNVVVIKQYMEFIQYNGRGLVTGTSGSLAYQAEESKSSKKGGQGIPSDLYSVAVTTFELFCGEKPFEMDEELCSDGNIRDVCYIRVSNFA